MTGVAGRRLVHVTTADISLALLLGPQLRAFADAGMEVIGASAPGPFVDELVASGIAHEPLRHATRSMAPGHDVLAVGELVRLFRRLRPDVVHTHNPKPGLYGRLAARIAGVPVIVNTVHGLYATPEDSRARRAVVYLLERAASLCSQAELVQNPDDLAVLRRLGVPKDKLVLLGNGVDLARFGPPRHEDDVRRARAALGVEPGRVVVGAVGRLVKQKGFRELFAAAARMRTLRPEVVFVVVGPVDDAKGDALGAADVAGATALGNVVFDLGRFGIQFVASPRHADGLVITGPVTRNMSDALRIAYEAVPPPRLVIAVGACGISGGPFIGSEDQLGGAATVVPVDLFIPGCPPHPVTILDGLLRLLGRLKDDRARPSSASATPRALPSA